MGAVSIEIRLSSIDRFIRKVHGGIRPLTMLEQNILIEYVYAIIREIENDWPILTGYSIVRWAPRLALSAGDTRFFLENNAWYADWVHSKGTRRVHWRWKGRALYKDLVAASFAKFKPHLIRDLKAQIEKSEQARPASGPQRQVATFEELMSKFGDPQ